MNKKFLAKILTVSMILTSAPAMPGMEISANAEELGIGSQTGGGDLDSVTSKRTAGETPDITTGLVGYYGFEDSLDNKASGTGGKATLHGGAGDTWNSPASGSALYANSKDDGFGKAYQFSGDTGTVEGGDFARGEGLQLDVNTSKSFTVSAWVNTAEKINFQPILFTNVDADNYVTTGTYYNDFASGGIVNYKTKWHWLDKNNNSSSVLKDLPLNEWTHIVLTFDDSGKAVLYYNAEVLSWQEISDYESGTFNNMPVFLGVNWWNASFKGLMDEVYIYNRVLSPEDVTELYNTGKIPEDQIPEPGDTGDGDEDTDNSVSTGEPGTDFSKITTQPVVKYTFENTEGIELAGEANVADGVLNLATKESDDVTYAKISDLSTFDFSNGITLTADVKVTGYKSDWTPIFMLGDGTLGGEGNDATGLYHLSQGFSSVGGSRASVTDTADWFIGYFGSGIATPYTWDWYNKTSNRNRWDTITVTINNNKMSTYIDGQLVQSAEGDYTKVLDAIKVAKNNYLGASYWKADGYFQGSLDNVGIYNTVLAADDISKLTSTKGENVVITTPKPLAPYPVVLPTPVPLPTPEPLPTSAPADGNATPEPAPVLEPETITGVAWWDAANERSRDYVLSGEGTMDLYVTFESTSDSNGYGAFNVELVSDGNRYITTGSDTNAWTGEQGTGTVSCPNLTNSTIIPGHIYRITIKRTNYDFSIIYYDLTDNKEYCSMEIKDTNQAIDVNIHVMAQVGKYIVSQKAPDVTAPSASATPPPSADPSASPDPSATAEPGSTEAPGTTDPGTNPGDKDPGTDNLAENPSDDDDKKDNETKKTMKVSGVTAKAGKKKVTGKLSVKGTKVTVKIGSKKAKNAKVNGKKFTFTASSKLKKGTKVTIKVTKSGYKAVTKTVKVK